MLVTCSYHQRRFQKNVLLQCVQVQNATSVEYEQLMKIVFLFIMFIFTISKNLFRLGAFLVKIIENTWTIYTIFYMKGSMGKPQMSISTYLLKNNNLSREKQKFTKLKEF